MSLFDFMFPQQAQAMHLRDIAESTRDFTIEKSRNRDDAWINSITQRQLNRRIEQLENDKRLLSLAVTILLKDYILKNNIEPDQLKELVKSIDKSDGVNDGGLDVDELRKVLGVHEDVVSDTSKISLCPDCGRAISRLQGKCLYCGYIKIK